MMSPEKGWQWPSPPLILAVVLCSCSLSSAVAYTRPFPWSVGRTFLHHLFHSTGTTKNHHLLHYLLPHLLFLLLNTPTNQQLEHRGHHLLHATTSHHHDVLPSAQNHLPCHHCLLPPPSSLLFPLQSTTSTSTFLFNFHISYCLGMLMSQPAQPDPSQATMGMVWALF